MNQQPNDGGPAFPVTSDNYAAKWCGDGMSLRDYFAAKALQGMLADTSVQAPPSEFAHNAYKLADAMLEARKAK